MSNYICKKLKILYFYRQLIYKFILFFIIPIILSFNIFWYDNIEIITSFDDKGISYYKISESFKNEVEAKPIRYVIKKIVKYPFNLNYYELCFTNNSNIIVDSKKEFIDAKLVNVSSNENEKYGELYFPPKEDNCMIINSKDEISYKTNLSIDIKNFFGQKIVVNTDIQPKLAKSIIYDRFASSFIFLLEYWGIVMLFITVIKNNFIKLKT